MHKHAHTHQTQMDAYNKLFLAALITLVFATIEGLFGWLSNALVLISDSIHMFADAFALGLSTFGSWLACKPPSKKHSYGLGRAEVIIAWISSLVMIIVCLVIIVEAIERYQQPHTIHSLTVISVAFLGLMVNTFIAKLLSQGHQTLNVRAAVLHVFSDLLGSAVGLISGIVIFLTEWHLIDPLLALMITLLIFLSSLRLVKEGLNILMEGVPAHLDIHRIKNAILKMTGVKKIHDLHVWTLSSGLVALSAHIQIQNFKEWPNMLNNMTELLASEFHIRHVTLQPETQDQVLKSRPKQ